MTNQQDRVSGNTLYAYMGSAARILEQLGYDNIPTDHNPVWLALAGLNPINQEQLDWMIDNDELTQEEADQLLAAADEGRDLATKLRVWRGKSSDKGAILKAFALCQTACLNMIGGPLRDGSLVSLRQRWYFSKSHRFMGFKMVSQSLEQYCIKSADIVLVDDKRAYRRAERMGAQRVAYKPNFKKLQEAALKAELNRQPRVHVWPKGGWGRTYAQTQSSILAGLVRSGLTYENLWMRDSSKYVSKQAPLITELHGALLIEKEKLFDAFQPFARALGFTSFVAMGGNNAFSTVEAILAEHYRDYNGQLIIDTERPLHLFVISDWDYYGLVPVQEGAVTQFCRYLGDNVIVHRVGISPDLVKSCGRSPIMAGYEIEEPDANESVRKWYNEHGIWVGEPWAPNSICKGIEIEALDPQQYVPYLVEAIIHAAGGDDEVRKALAKLAEPEWWNVMQNVTNDAADYSRLHALLEALEDWACDENNARIINPLNSFIDEQIEKGTKFWCPHCKNDIVTVTGACPECGTDLNYEQWAIQEDGVDPWKDMDHVCDAIAEIVQKKGEGINLTQMVNNAIDKGSVFRPVSSSDANAAATELFLDEYNRPLSEIVDNADDSVLIWLLEGVYETLEGYGLEFPDGATVDPDYM